MDAQENLANLRVESFSYYLNPGEENFVQKITNHVEDPLPTPFPITPSGKISPIIKPSQNFNFSHPFSTAQEYNLSNSINGAQEKFVFTVKAPPPVQDLNAAALLLPRISPVHHVERINSNGEIGVFGADKYFNMRLEDDSRMKHENRNEGMKSNLRPGPGTPSISSEASTRNSQAALLRNSSENISRTRPRRAAIGRGIFGSFSCKGSCLDNGAFCVAEDRRAEKVHQPKSERIDHSNHFAFPILKSDEPGNMNVMKQLDDHEEKLDDQARRSLEVFGSGGVKKGDIATNLAMKLSMLTWDAIPKASNHATTSKGSTTICDDMTSDASSDLFEIEDISGSTGYAATNMAFRDTLNTDAAGDDIFSAGCMSPPTQYAPSEASIEWSVVTASAADFSSGISDYDEKNVSFSGGFIPSNTVNRNYRSKTPGGKEAQKIRPGGLLGCKSHKAVNVAETVQKTRVERY